MLPPYPREERRRTQEKCLYCTTEYLTVTAGVILNESATGILLEASSPLETGKQIWVLPVYHDTLRPESLSTHELINHPLTRVGVVVRLESGNRAGIQFKEEPDRPQYRRWYRGGTTITSFFIKHQGVLAYTGPLTLETASLTDKIMSQAAGVTELLVSCHQIDQIQRTAFTVFLSSLQAFEKKGITLTVVTGPVSSAYFQKSLALPGSYICYVSETGAGAPPAESAPDGPASQPGSAKSGILLVARSLTTLNRLEKPVKNQDMPVWKLQGFGSAVKLIASERVRFMVVDIDLESCGTIVQLNQLKNAPLDPVPPVLAIGPGYLAALVKEALFLPVRIYLNKPTTEREYAAAMQTMLTETVNGAMAVKNQNRK